MRTPCPLFTNSVTFWDLLTIFGEAFETDKFIYLIWLVKLITSNSSEAGNGCDADDKR